LKDCQTLFVILLQILTFVTVLTLNDINFEFGGRYLYRNASWQINPGEKIGLVGRNGTGKSTLLRIINGEYSIESGEINAIRGLSLGFLNQDLLSFSTDAPIEEVALSAFEEALTVEKQIADTLIKIENGDESQVILEKLHDLQERFEQLDGYRLRQRTAAMLEGLGFSTADLQRPYKEFSGGWRMRVMLARIVLREPDLLLLDEPTNHLDLPSIQWVEEFLQKYRGTVIIVSHDRWFLDRIVNKIAEIAQQKITLYSGNFSDYIQQKTERLELQDAQYRNQQQYIKEQQKLIDRFRYKASKAKMAQSRIKMLDKLEKVDAIEDDGPEIRVRFAINRQPGKKVAALDILEKSFGELHLLKNTNATILRGDKIALIGANGKGKSTLLRMINGSESYKGAAEAVHEVHPAFYAQHQLESLHLQNDLITELSDWATDRKESELRALLGAFLFSGDDVFKKISVLSGGEKARVALAKTILTEANFLIRDEPTNHLDMHSVSILIEVLEDYEGTFIVVSHDRHFLSCIANKIWWIEDQQLKEYPGNYEEFEQWQREQTARKSLRQEQPKVAKPEPKKVEKTISEDEKKEAKKLKQRFDRLDQELTRLNQHKSELESQLSLPEVYSDSGRFQQMMQQFNELESRIGNVTSEWEEVFEKMSGLDA
ncbi:MAG: ABC-F family ATP-binding cassette domain-containing protein, partial [Bacteroidota bacterium]